MCSCKNKPPLSALSDNDLADAVEEVLKEVANRNFVLFSNDYEDGIDPQQIIGIRKEFQFGDDE